MNAKRDFFTLKKIIKKRIYKGKKRMSNQELPSFSLTKLPRALKIAFLAITP